MNRVFIVSLGLIWALLLSACATPGFQPELKMSDAEINPESVTEHALRWLPSPNQSISVAVYGIADETGAFKPSEGGQTLSRAVTQAPTPILIKALHDAGNRSWFDVIERENLGNLIKERQIVQEMRARYLGETELNRDALPALKFAGVLIEGAITGYDTNTRTGGAGARYLGIGGSTQYREDSVTVSLRVVSVKTGEVLVSITSQQRVASVALQGDAFRFVSFQKLLEAEAGITLNQPRHMAVRQALEKAVYGLIIEGAEIGLWGFEDQTAGIAAFEHYRAHYAPVTRPPTRSDLPPEFYQAHMDRQNRQRAQFAAARSVTTLRPQPAQQARRDPEGSTSDQEGLPVRMQNSTPATAELARDEQVGALANKVQEYLEHEQLSALDALSLSSRGHFLYDVQLIQKLAGIDVDSEEDGSVRTAQNPTRDVLASTGHSGANKLTGDDTGAAANLVLLNSGGGR